MSMNPGAMNAPVASRKARHGCPSSEGSNAAIRPSRMPTSWRPRSFWPGSMTSPRTIRSNGGVSNPSPPDLGLHRPRVHVLPPLDRPVAQLLDELHQPVHRCLEQDAALFRTRLSGIAMDTGLRP